MEDFLQKPEDLSDCGPETRVDVADVTSVPVSPSSEVTEFCDGFSFALLGNLWNRSPFLSSQACSLLDSYAGRDEV